MTHKKQNRIKHTGTYCEGCQHQTRPELADEVNYEEFKKTLVEIPKALIEEMQILASNPNPRPAPYLLFTKKPSDNLRVDGYTRISQSYDNASYDVNEVIKLVKAGRFPVLILELRTGPARPSPREIITWWLNDHALGFPLNHGIISFGKETVEFKVFSLRECFFCEKKSEPLKNLELRW